MQEQEDWYHPKIDIISDLYGSRTMFCPQSGRDNGGDSGRVDRRRDGLLFLRRPHRKSALFLSAARRDGKQEGNGPKDERATMKMDSEVKSDIRFEISNHDYPGIRVHIASNSHFGIL